MMHRLLQMIVFVGGALVIASGLYWWNETIHRGGPIMILILMCSVFSLTVIIERAMYFFFRLHPGMNLDRFFEALRSAVDDQRWHDAHGLCQASPGPVARVVLAGLAAHDGTPKEIDEVMEEAAHSELPHVERHLRWLSTLAQVSTLLGLLGTVTGLVRAFQVIQLKTAGGNPVSPGDLAGGVWEALITTVAGLCVAIPTILAYNYFASRVGEVQFQMERAAALVTGWRRHKKGTPPHP